ncbi:hypothetical protein BKA19_2609 [Blastococcus saxobsidens]|uniref:Uncharacterized protein n=1 Tax=Blastococcus saxobsidens TaxID=138336 RepID=A0A4Q7Y793_9ACTN|nr:hypothetical protein BKA19_2609 [Blastococcus saxobsidens]
MDPLLADLAALADAALAGVLGPIYRAGGRESGDVSG